MPLTCDFTGSYYDPAPWTERPCAAEYSVPEGCPIHFVTGAPMPFDGWNLSAQVISPDGTGTLASSTTKSIGSDEQDFTVMDTLSCDCAWTTMHVSFQHMEVDVPSAVAGDSVILWGAGVQSQFEIEITAAAPCPTPEWPTEYRAGLACDRCPEPVDEDDDHWDGPGDFDVGCSAGGDPSLLLAGLVLLPFLRRRAKIVSSK
ncbi:MAG TPA: hypothetical protein VMZ53_31765 [Kofleriaceae bacterium]|nr:hypothetical protein [Kofleriaceae bacterium]